MTAPTDADRPLESTATDITLVTRGITINACVERSGEDYLLLRPTSGAFAREVGVRLGDPVELFWRAGYEERTLPARIVEIHDEESPSWQLRVTGVAERSQRRKAVRARVQLPVTVVCNGTQLLGETIDLSEAGMRADVDGWGLPPEPATPVQVGLVLESGVVDLYGEVVRQLTQGARWQLSMKFDGVAEHDQDRLRQRVFQALPEERVRTAD